MSDSRDPVSWGTFRWWKQRRREGWRILRRPIVMGPFLHDPLLIGWCLPRYRLARISETVENWWWYDKSRTICLSQTSSATSHSLWYRLPSRLYFPVDTSRRPILLSSPVTDSSSNLLRATANSNDWPSCPVPHSDLNFLFFLPGYRYTALWLTLRPMLTECFPRPVTYVPRFYALSLGYLWRAGPTLLTRNWCGTISCTIYRG